MFVSLGMPRDTSGDTDWTTLVDYRLISSRARSPRDSRVLLEVAESAAGLAERILYVHGDGILVGRLCTAGVEQVNTHFEEEVVGERLRIAAGLPIQIFA